MKKIRALFLSLQPSMLLTFINFFLTDPIILPDVSGYDDYKRHKDSYQTIIMDDGSLKKNEFEILRGIINSKCNCKKIIYTSSYNEEYLNLIEIMGADGIVSKNSGLEILKEAIIKTEGGTKYHCAYIDNFLKRSKVFTERLKSLTDREKQILIFMKQGYTNLEISEMLSLSVKTIEAHKENMKVRMGVRSIKELHKYLTEIES